jgi:ribosomal protein S18 acetylase RimI-like enzyme
VPEAFVELGEEHRAAVADFECHRSGQEWSEGIEYMIRRYLIDTIGDSGVRAIGYFENGLLLGVTSWSPDRPDLWTDVVLAVRTGHFDHGIGRKLETHFLQRAMAEGVERVFCRIHEANAPMLHLSKKWFKGGRFP